MTHNDNLAAKYAFYAESRRAISEHSHSLKDFSYYLFDQYGAALMGDCPETLIAAQKTLEDFYENFNKFLENN